MSDIRYDAVRERFVVHMKRKPGPYQLDTNLVCWLMLETGQYAPTSGILARQWRALVRDFCPVWLTCPKHIMIPDALAELDASDNYIYAIGYLLASINHIVCLSQERSAYMLRVAHGVPVFRKPHPMAMIPWPDPWG